MTTQPVELLSFKPTGTTTKRGLADWASDNFLNVKNFGAVGDNVTDDTAAIQACFDAAFTTSGTPHGTNSYLNKPVYFPAGQYRARDLLLTQVKGGLIYGSASQTTSLQYIGAAGANSTIIKTNGCEHVKFQNLSFLGYGPTVTIVGLDLDWNGIGSIGLKNNSFLELGFGNLHTGLRIGESGFEGYGNYGHQIGAQNGTYGIKVKSTGVNTFVVTSPSENNAGNPNPIGTPSGVYGYGFFGVSGSLVIIDTGCAGAQNDFKWDSSGTLIICGGRSESLNFLEITNGIALLLGCQYDSGFSLSSSWKRFVNMTSPATVVMDACKGIFSPSVIGTGNLYIRGGTIFEDGSNNAISTYLSNFTGQCREYMVPTAIPFANLPSPREGLEVSISDANLSGKVWGDVITGGSTGHALVRWNGSAWTLVGK